MKIWIFTLCSILFAQLVHTQSMILSIVHEPEEITTTDSISFIVEYQFPSSDCILDSNGASPEGTEIQAFSHYCLGPLTALCYRTDTFQIDPLQAGEYAFILSLSAGMGTVPCTPGIIIDDLDTLNFIVSALSGTEDPVNPEFFLYPNPVSNQLYFSMPLTSVSTVFNINGKPIMSINGGSTEIDVSSMPSGLYSLEAEGIHHRWIKL